ncbi:SDR family oxidoreductase [Rhodococcus sp. (in: high G+C Gram-positive bacteria)]|uniref:SDR family NAD(P)-dependent oxidoreductase n=1 Tax=Rhodococcus sp. TaxID=1831 RepID=UPI00257F4BA8|nr:SDR family oxidoreductase [Rhodococcus sp. (in: high G+C Gram-positive bacteria)]
MSDLSSESQSSFCLRGRKALVTGASRGIGKAIAKALAGAGADVVLSSRSVDALNITAAEIERMGRSAAVIAADLSEHSSISDFVDRAEEGGPIDIVCHAAGAQHREAATTFPLEEWEHVLAVNLTLPFLLSQEIGRRQLERQVPGSHVFVASLTSVLGLPDLVAYNAAKSGLMGVVRALSREWSGQGLRFNAVSPGYVETEMTKDLFADEQKRASLLARIPMGEFGTPEQLGAPAVFLASNASEYMTGQLLIIDGGWAAA